MQSAVAVSPLYTSSQRGPRVRMSTVQPGSFGVRDTGLSHAYLGGESVSSIRAHLRLVHRLVAFAITHSSQQRGRDAGRLVLEC